MLLGNHWAFVKEQSIQCKTGCVTKILVLIYINDMQYYSCFKLIYLRSIAKQVIPTYINHFRPLIPDGSHLFFFNEVWEEREARPVLICWALSKEASGTILIMSLVFSIILANRKCATSECLWEGSLVPSHTGERVGDDSLTLDLPSLDYGWHWRELNTSTAHCLYTEYRSVWFKCR